MKNFGDDIVELLNFIRPKNYPILREKMFTSDKTSDMTFKENGLEYFKSMSRGYVSYFRGAQIRCKLGHTPLCGQVLVT